MAKENKEFLVCNNKRAFHDYNILEKYEAGIVLQGTEIKSMRKGMATLQDAYCEIKNDELFLRGLHISKYEQGNIFNHDPDRIKKLLVHKNEILKLDGRKTKDGFTIIPLKVYIVGGLCKVEIAVAKGKKLYDKREDLKKEDQERYIERSEKYY